ncbi:sensor histidine kinase [Actinomadura physcomitrii]|uniref:sensor histidine kinase n=1 Tax=Actinomadura physcomitrii TaxID=2650748 RepID=UPI00136BA2F7|nr:nitrate- and nitrite sensing domain-containing protein [Actinomadura physcomitrii]
MGLWAFAASLSLGTALDKLAFTEGANDVARPIVLAGVSIQQERTAAAIVLGSSGKRGVQQLTAAEAATDGAINTFRSKSLPAAKNALPKTAQRLLSDLERQLQGIRELRSAIRSGSITPVDALSRYNSLFDSTNKVLISNIAAINDAGVYRTTIAVVNTNWSRDYMLREDALLSAMPLRNGRMPAAEYAAFAQAAGNRKLATDVTLASPSAEVGRALRPLVRSPQYARYQQLEDNIAASNHALPTDSLREWRSLVPAISGAWWKAELATAEALTDQTEAAGRKVVLQLILIAGVGLVVVVITILLSVRFARALSGELRGLQRTAQHLAEEHLPAVIARLRKGEEVSTPTVVSRFGSSRTREVAQVADAFTKVQRTAVEAAIGEAGLRKGISRVFINLAWRSQSLLHRQLSMLDSMERRTSDPKELEDLFRLDHLTTRMRRHAEGLVILSGSEIIRGWDNPVPVDDLLRAALAEVENYPRVEVETDCTASVSGAVVADVVHLLAELIENATMFSPPHTEVSVRAELVANGLAVEVVDRGVGLDADELAAINRRLAQPPEFDLADSDRLGLFVVARLAARHGIRVILQPSAYAGVTAVVLLPMSLLMLDGPPPSPSKATSVPRRLASYLPDNVPAGEITTNGRHMAAPRSTPTWEEDQPFEPSPNVTAPAPEDPETDGLPRRTRQRHLAPELRATAPANRGGHAMEEGLDEHRPEDSRDLLSSLQAGWTAGRAADDGEDIAPRPHLPHPSDDRLPQAEP